VAIRGYFLCVLCALCGYFFIFFLRAFVANFSFSPRSQRPPRLIFLCAFLSSWHFMVNFSAFSVPSVAIFLSFSEQKARNYSR